MPHGFMCPGSQGQAKPKSGLPFVVEMMCDGFMKNRVVFTVTEIILVYIIKIT